MLLFNGNHQNSTIFTQVYSRTRLVFFLGGGGNGGAKKTVAVKHVRFVKRDAQTRQIKNVVNRHSHQAEIF